MGRIGLVAVALSASALLCAARAQGLTDRQILALNNLQQDLSTCSTFYSISAKGIGPDISADRAEASERADMAGEALLRAAFMIGQLIGMTDAAMTARLKFAAEDMAGTLSGSWVNYSALLAIHLKPCSELLDTYPDRFESALKE